MSVNEPYLFKRKLRHVKGLFDNFKNIVEDGNIDMVKWNN